MKKDLIFRTIISNEGFIMQNENLFEVKLFEDSPLGNFVRNSPGKSFVDKLTWRDLFDYILTNFLEGYHFGRHLSNMTFNGTHWKKRPFGNLQRNEFGVSLYRKEEKLLYSVKNLEKILDEATRMNSEGEVTWKTLWRKSIGKTQWWMTPGRRRSSY